MSGSPEREEELFRRAVAAFEAGELETALNLFLQVAALGGRYQAEAMTYLARISGPIAPAASYAPPAPSYERPSRHVPPPDPPPPPPPTWFDRLRLGIRGIRPAEAPSPVIAAAPIPAAPAPEPLRRTPHMDLSPAPPAAPGSRLKVSVYTDAGPFGPEEQGDDVILEGLPGQNRFDVQIWLVVGDPFMIEGPAVLPLMILRDRERSAAAEFTVVRGAAGAPGSKATFSAYFAYEGRACGKVTRAVPLGAGDAVPVAAGSASVHIETGVRPADLTIRIVAREEDEHAFECNVQTGLLPEYENGKTAPWRLKSLAANLVSQHMERFTAEDAEDSVRTLALRGAGIQLFEAAPKLFQKVFWELIDAGTPPRTISIVTEEPYIPWELMVPTRTRPDGEEEEREPLGVEFLIGRWTSREHIAAPQHIPLRDAWVVAPRDSQLANAEEEAAMVLQELHGERIDPACISGLQSAFARNGRTLLHVICHGKSGEAGSQVLAMENEEPLDASYLRAMSGLKQGFRTSRPFVFLNACEVGRKEPALVGVGGFAEQFMILGASAVIAPLWSVKDSIAHQVAVEFYEGIEKEPRVPFAEILRGLRKRSYAEEGGEDTWAAYCFYGDPLAARL